MDDNTLAERGIRIGDELVVAEGEFKSGAFHAVEWNDTVRVLTLNSSHPQLIGRVIMPDEIIGVPVSGTLDTFNVPWEADIYGNITKVDPALASEVFGRSVESLIGYGFLDIIHREDRPRVAYQWASAILSGEAFTMTARAYLREGHIADVCALAMPIFDESKNVVSWSGVSQPGYIVQVA
jgi:PAS domain S-box-containing protein